MKHEILFTPAWDKTDPDPKKNYGVKDLGIIFMVDGGDKATCFEISTNWYQKHVMKKRLDAMKRDVLYEKEDFLIERWISPYPMDVFYVSEKQMSEDDVFWDDGWRLFNNSKPCYYGYRYEPENEEKVWTTDFVYWLLIEQGIDPVWGFLDNYYKETFGNG